MLLGIRINTTIRCRACRVWWWSTKAAIPRIPRKHSPRISITPPDAQQQQQAHTDTVTGKEEVTYKHENHTHGNIGVTTSQQMLESEREVALFNFVGIVAHDIIKLIAICIY